MGVSKETIEAIRDASDIVDIVQSYIPLKKAGGAYKALCPFHKEKTPSFNINPSRQSFHCFGCHAGGDVFSFVQQIDGLDFMGAVNLLAQRAGITIQYDDGTPRGDGQDKDRLFRVMSMAEEMYRLLLDDARHGKVAREYLEDRRLNDETVRAFGIGYAPPSRGIVMKWADKKKISFKHLVEVGLMAESEQGERYERFRARLMFPIHDGTGRTVGFSGRLLDPDAKTAKYLNSPETRLFKKSRLLYGMNQARRAIVDSGTAVICEGQIDVIRCHEAGFTNTVAPLGTALTAEHAHLIKRHADTVVLLFDADSAGQAAAIRSGHECLREGLTVRVAALPGGSDPDSFLLEHGAESFARILDAAEPLVDYQLRLLRSSEDLTSQQGLMRASSALFETMACTPSETQLESMLRQAAAGLGTSIDALSRDYFAQQKKRRRPASQEKEPRPAAASAPVPARESKADFTIAELMYESPPVVELVRKYLPGSMLSDPDCRRLVEILLAHNGNPPGGLMAHLGDDNERQRKIAARLDASPDKVGKEFTREDAVKEMILVYHRKHLEKMRQQLRLQIKQATGDQRTALSQECHQLTVDLHALKSAWDQAEPILAAYL